MLKVPFVSQREYIKPLWKMKRNGAKGALVCHNCAKCGTQLDGKAKGVWFERADNSGLWRFVCESCCLKPRIPSI
jgi:hypothetical protein